MLSIKIIFSLNSIVKRDKIFINFFSLKISLLEISNMILSYFRNRLLFKILFTFVKEKVNKSFGRSSVKLIIFIINFLSK